MTTTRPLCILTVCTGNIHRSPLAAALLRAWADRYLGEGLAAEVDTASAGTAAVESAPMSRRAMAIARALKADGSQHRAAMLSEAMIARADLILTAEVAHRDRVVSLVPNAVRRTFTMREAGRAADGLLAAGALAAPGSRDEIAARIDRLPLHRSAGDDDIVDPQGAPADAALQMTAELVPPLAALAQVLLGMPPHAVAAYEQATTDTDMLRALIAAAEHSGAE